MTHSPNPGYEPGNHWLVCDRCGFDIRKAEAKKEWNGLWVCDKCYEARHPQDFVKGRAEKPAADPVRPPPTDEVRDVDFADIVSTIPSGTFNNNL
jgi:ribosomal protein L40E